MITTKIKHVAINAYPQMYFDLYKGFVEGGSFNHWMAQVEECTKAIVDEDEIRQEEMRDKLRGDMLEVFAEIFFALFSVDEGVGLSEYEPVTLDEDYGVDAVGTNVNGHRVAVQIKYRGNPAIQIEYKELARTFASAVCQLHLTDVANHDHTLYLFTSGKGENPNCRKVFGRKLVVVNRGIICHKTDNNVRFWREAFTMIYNTLNSE